MDPQSRRSQNQVSLHAMVEIAPRPVEAAFAACSNESREFTVHEAGQYKGAKDPLLGKNLHKELIDRFKMVQTDR